MIKSIFYIQQKKKKISSHLRTFLKKEQNSFTSDVPFVHDTFLRLTDFTLNGKMIRGSLFLLSCEMFGEKIAKEHIAIASALELFHSALLIHDDIMDNDITRRGKDTIFHQYELVANEQQLANARHYGNGMAICIGDISLFLTFSLFSQIKKSTTIQKKLIAYFTKEAQKVGFGQMQDFTLGNTKNETDIHNIISVYKYKTARYTFSLPLALGAIMSAKDTKTIHLLEQIGEYAGFIFQIRDDELRYVDSEKQIGKTVGSDIRENTKTIFRHLLFERATPKEKMTLSKIFGNNNASENDFIYVRNMMTEKNIFTDIKKDLTNYEKQAIAAIDSLNVSSTYKTLLQDLVSYMYTRTK